MPNMNPYLMLAREALGVRHTPSLPPDHADPPTGDEGYELHEIPSTFRTESLHHSPKMNEETLAIHMQAVQRLVERVGKREVYIYQQRHMWDADEHERRFFLLLADHAELDRHLQITGARIEEHGWTVAPDGRWHRNGEQPVEVIYSEAEHFLQDSLPAAWTLLLRGVTDEATSVTLAALEADLGAAVCDFDMPRLHRLMDEYMELCTQCCAATENPQDSTRDPE